MDSNDPRTSEVATSAVWAVRADPLASRSSARGSESAGRPLRALFDQHLSLERLWLWVLEVLLCTLVVYGLLSVGDHWQEMGEAKAAALALTFGVTSVAVGLYDPDVYLETRQLLLSTAVGVLLAVPALLLVGVMLGVAMPHLTGAGTQHAIRILFGFVMLLFGVRLAFSFALRSDLLVRRMAVLGADVAAARTVAAVRSLHRGIYEMAVVLPADAAAPIDGALAARGVRGLILAGPEAAARLEELRRSHGRLRIYTEAEFWETQLRRINVDDPSVHWAGPGWAGPDAAGRLATSLRRGFDIVLSLGLLAFTAPLMLAAAVAIKLDSPGPVIYRQERVGLGGRTFTVMKFRSMRQDAEARGPVWAASRDSRVTRVGGFIRLVRIDELPQLVNVLRGEMSFIGPRPERPHFVQQLQRSVPFYADRALVKPGLTGWAQVNYPYGASVEDARAKLSYDLYYVKHRGLLLDLLILLGTVRVVLFQRGAR